MAARLAILVVCLLVFAAAPDAASAAFAQRPAGSSTLTVAGAGEQNTVTVSLSGGSYTITDTAGMGEGNGCSSVDANTASCTAAPVASITADLGDGNDNFSSTAPTPLQVLAGSGQDDVTGGSGADDLVGGPGNDTLRGGAGDDTITGETVAGDTGTGQNTMSGGAGDDTIEGGAGPDTITGDADGDTIDGAAGADTVDGGDGNDLVSGGDGNDTMSGGAGDDQVGEDPGPGGELRDRGDDSIAGGAGNDLLLPGAGPQGGGTDGDTIAGGDGADEVTYASRTVAVNVSIDGAANDGVAGERDNVASDVETVTGGSGDDQISGGSGPETLDGGLGADALNGGGGNDTTDGGQGNDSASGGPGADVVVGGPGDDHLDGSASPLVGVDGGDVVSGGDGNDQLAGGDGNDSLDGGAGADDVSGGAGDDSTSYASATSPVFVTLDGRAGDGQFGEGDNVHADVENLGGWSGQDTFTGNEGANTLDSGGGEDYVDGGAGQDSLIAGSAFDVVRARDGVADNVDCGDSSDFAIVDTRDIVAKSCERIDRGLKKRPLLGRRLLVRPVRSGTAFGLLGMHRTVPLKDVLVVPFGTKVDATSGSARMTTAGAGRRTQTAVFSQGAFLVKQKRSLRGLTDVALTGGDLTKCGGATVRGRATAVPAARTVLRRLFGRAHGRFRTRGRFSTATVRGTAWQVVDRCDGTLTRVLSGTVRVRDLARHRTITLRRGQSYLARPRGGGLATLRQVDQAP